MLLYLLATSVVLEFIIEGVKLIVLKLTASVCCHGSLSRVTILASRVSTFRSSLVKVVPGTEKSIVSEGFSESPPIKYHTCLAWLRARPVYCPRSGSVTTDAPRYPFCEYDPKFGQMVARVIGSKTSSDAKRSGFARFCSCKK